MVRSDDVGADGIRTGGFVGTGVPEGWPIDEPPERRMELRSRDRRSRRVDGVGSRAPLHEQARDP